MLKILGLSFIGALICTLITVVIGAIARRDWDDIIDRLEFNICSFIIEFIWMDLLLYFSCKPFTLITVLMWMWPAVLANILISAIFFDESSIKSDYVSHWILVVISGFSCLASLFSPVQNLIYVHDMSNTDVSYAVSSDEILAKVELKINNSDWRDKYDVDSPEMRQVKGKNIAVYHIKDTHAQSGGSSTEYIPGFAIQKENELPQIVSKRIYFDTSYINKKDALRTVRRKYQTVVIGAHKFDMDDDYNPYEIFEYRENLFFTNGKDYGIIVLNLMDGTSEKYQVEEIPDWVDFKTTYPR